MFTRLVPVLTLAVTFCSIGVVTVSYAQNPTAVPPAGNAFPPLNVGGTGQVKTGAISANGLVTPADFVKQFDNSGSNVSATPDSEYRITANDGQGNLNIYTNASKGPGGQYLSNGAAFRDRYNPSGNGFYGRYYSAPGTAGSAVSWLPYMSIAPGPSGTVTNYTENVFNEPVTFGDTINVATICGGAGGSCVTQNDIQNVVVSGGGTSWAVNANNIYNTNTGNVGIGTSAPLTALHIEKTQPYIRLKDSNNAAADSDSLIQFYDSQDTFTGYMGKINDNFYITSITGSGEIRLATNNGTDLRIDPTGDVAIGSINIDGTLKLDVNGSIGATAYCDGLGTNCFTAAAVSAGSSIWSLNGSDAYRNPGSIGIGTDSPTSKLDVVGTIRASSAVEAGNGSGSVTMTINDGGGNSNLTFNHRGRVPDQDGNAGRITVNTDATSGAYMQFQLKDNVSEGAAVNLDSILTLQSTGNVGIGEFAPTSRLVVANTSDIGSVNDTSAGILIKNSAETGFLAIDNNEIQTHNGTVGTNLNINPFGGKITVGSGAAGGEKLDVRGDIKGDSFIYSSDRRLKENITPYVAGYSMLNGLMPSRYSWKDGRKSGWDMGLIAQDVQKIVPEAVTRGEDGYLAIDYAKLIVPVISVLKQQQQTIEALESRIDRLESRN